MADLKTKTIIAFDLYGTLLSTESIADELGKLYGSDHAIPLAALWRRYQLEYTWRINSMGLYRSFSDITRGALEHAVAETGLSLSADDSTKLMEAYNSLHVFPEIPAALDAVKENPLIEAYVFSNGTGDMVSASINTSPDLKRYADCFKGQVTVDGVEAFKPDMKTYYHFLQEVGLQGQAGSIWIITANPFDVVGATAAGWRSAWIDRKGNGWVDRLGDVIGDIRPTIVVSGVDKAVGEIIKMGS